MRHSFSYKEQTKTAPKNELPKADNVMNQYIVYVSTVGKSFDSLLKICPFGTVSWNKFIGALIKLVIIWLCNLVEQLIEPDVITLVLK